jgi:hypothetical protein
MPSGIYLSKTYLEQIWHSKMILEMSVAEIFETVFKNDINKIGIKHLKCLCDLGEGGQNNDRFFDPRLPRTGGPELKIGPVTQALFLAIFAENPQSRLKRAREIFSVDHYAGIDVTSLSTFSRGLLRAIITRKVLERSHFLSCPIKRAAYKRRTIIPALSISTKLFQPGRSIFKDMERRLELYFHVFRSK